MGTTSTPASNAPTTVTTVSMLGVASIAMRDHDSRASSAATVDAEVSRVA
jgi:hypothetical protein